MQTFVVTQTECSVSNSINPTLHVLHQVDGIIQFNFMILDVAVLLVVSMDLIFVVMPLTLEMTDTQCYVVATGKKMQLNCLILEMERNSEISIGMVQELH